MKKNKKKQKYPQDNNNFKKISCLTKMGFNSAESAIESKSHTKFKTYAYKCEFCKLWHTTRKRKRF